MVKIIVVFAIILISSAIYAQTGPQSGFYFGGHDSLLFDGAGENTSYLQETNKDCLVKVLLVKGNITGTVLTRKLEEMCTGSGIFDTVIVREKRLLKKGDMVETGQSISTENDNDFVIAQLADGENLYLSGERGRIVVSDFCKSPPNIYMSLEAGKLGIDWNPLLPKTITICTEEGCLRIKGTVITMEIVKEGDVVSTVLKVYEGSAAFGRNLENPVNKKAYHDKAEQIKQLSEDFKSGKIGMEEFSNKMQVLQQEVKGYETEITVSAGYLCRIIGTGGPSVPEAFDINENRWWENK